jgi:hypothetical protein
MIDVRTAVLKAVEYVRQFQDYLPRSEIRLEETEFVDPRYWEITLSFVESGGLPSFGITTQRIYKIFRIDAETADVISMKVRTLAGAA